MLFGSGFLGPVVSPMVVLGVISFTVPSPVGEVIEPPPGVITELMGGGGVLEAASRASSSFKFGGCVATSFSGSILLV